MVRVLAVIPARWASTRFPGKPLADVLGKPMVQRVYEQVLKSRRVERVVVGTDDERIARAVRAFGGEARMTSSRHPSGTDRVAEVAWGEEAELVVNVQGDEPFIHPEVIDRAVDALCEGEEAVVSTLMHAIEEEGELTDPNVVKVVVDRQGYALYFSRAPIPYFRDDGRDRGGPAFKHLGLYVYRKPFLLRLTSLKPTPLERAEKLEQLRVLEHGYRIKVLETPHRSIGIDVPEDILRLEELPWVKELIG